MMEPINLPLDVIEYIRGVFAICNHRTSAKLTRMPTTHETSLDLTFIEALSQFCAPRRTDSDWIVRLDAHYLGGGRHFGEWEIADIGFIVVFRRSGVVQRRKVALLQSKRLYPQEQGPEEDTATDYMIGFARLMQGDDDLAAMKDRTFSFSENCRYKAFRVRDGQYKRMEGYEHRHSIPVHYLLYHPLTLPWSQVIPVQGNAPLPESSLGAQVKRARDVRAALTHVADNSSPAFSDLRVAAGWTLENFDADQLVQCHEGFVAQGPQDPGLFHIFNRRSGPIAAAISVTIDEP
jgi:hypothetical protein